MFDKFKIYKGKLLLRYLNNLVVYFYFFFVGVKLFEKWFI